jgi:hypothetical protein
MTICLELDRLGETSTTLLPPTQELKTSEEGLDAQARLGNPYMLVVETISGSIIGQVRLVIPIDCTVYYCGIP